MGTDKCKFSTVRSIIILFLIGTFFILLFTYFNSTNITVPRNISLFYNDFLEAFSKGTFDDIDPYLHFEVSLDHEMTEANFTNLLKYEILSWEKLSDNLWLATTYAETDQVPSGFNCNHFVGYIEKQLYVMIGAYQVPEALLDYETRRRFISDKDITADEIIAKFY